MVALGLTMAGASTVDAITAQMLPITARHFTDNIALIGAMVAMNRFCGFLLQPYAAWKSDSHRGPGGRRRPFLLAAWPVVFAGVGLLGALPFLVPEAHQRTAWAVAVLFLVNLAMQAALDICYGSGDPLYGDTFGREDLGRANGVRMIVTTAVGVAMGFAFVPLADHHEFWPYAGAMTFVAVAYTVTRRGIRETPPTTLPAPRPYHPLKPLAELRDPRTRKIAVCGTAVLCILALTEMLHALFVTETLGFSKTVLGGTSTAALLVSFAMPYPVGWLVDRYGARRVMMAGFAAMAAVEAGFVLWVDDLASLTVALVAFKAAWVVAHLPMIPLMFRDTPAERRGAVFGAVQMTRAGVAGVATVAAAGLADLTENYRVCYLLAGGACVAGFWAAARLEEGPGETAAETRP